MLTRLLLAVRWRKVAVMLTLAACGPSEPGTPNLRAHGPCGAAEHLRDRVKLLLTDGKLDRARRVIARADELCPATEPDSWATRLSILLDLGLRDEALQLAARVEGSSLASADARAAAIAVRDAPALPPPQPDELFRAAKGARRAGKAADAQRLFDRALVDLERAAAADASLQGETDTSTAVRLDMPNGLSGEVTAVGWDETNQYIAVAHGAFVSILDATTLREKWRLPFSSPCRCTSMAFAPSGRYLALGTSRGVEVFDARAGRRLWSSDEGHANRVSFASDGTSVLAWSWSGDHRRCRLREWGAVTGKSLLDTHNAKEPPDAVSGDARRAARHSDDDRITIIDAETGAPVKPLKWKRLKDQRLPLLLALDGTGTTAAVVKDDAHSGTGTVTVWGGDFEQTFDVQTRTRITALGLSPDGRTMVLGGVNGEALFVDVEGKRETSRIEGHSSNVRSLAFTKHGELLTGFGDGAARRWDAAGRVTKTIETGSGEVIGFAPGGALVIGGCGDLSSVDTFAEPMKDGGDHICLWDGRTGVRRDILSGYRSAQNLHSEVGWAWSGDGAWVAIASVEGLRLWDVKEKKLRATLRSWHCDVTNYCDAPRAMAFDPSRPRLAEGDSAAEIWSLQATSTRLQYADDHHRQVAALAWAPDGESLASSSVDGWLRLHAVPNSGAPVQSGGLGASDWHDSIALAFDADARRLAAARLDGRVELWDVGGKRLLRSLDAGAEQPVTLAFHPNGQMLAVGYRSGRTLPHGELYERRFPTGSIRLWSTTDGRSIATLRAIDGTGDSYVFTEGPNARIEFFGDAGRRFALCRAGARTLPFEACAERFEVTGLVEKRLARDERAYLEP